jgi:hypothetical protein
MAYGQKYQLQFTDLDKNVIKVIISQDGYSGALMNFVGSENPTVTKLDKSGDDRFEPLKPTSMEIGIFVDKAGDYDEFYEIDNFEYRVDKYLNSVLDWSGYINDELSTEEYSQGKYFISLTATDGMSILKGRYTELTGRVSHLTMIRECLDAIGLGLNIVDAIGVTEVGHTTGGPLSQTYFNADLFVEDSARWTLEEVLRDILKTYGACISQVHGKWVISNVESFYSGITGSEYTSSGVYVGSYIGDGEKEILHTLGAGVATLLTGGSIQKNKGWKELKVKQNYGKIDTVSGLILNGDFSTHEGYSAGDDYSGSQSRVLLLTGWENSPSLDPLPHLGVKIRTHASTGDYVYIIEPGPFESSYWIRSKVDSFPVLEASTTKTYVFSFYYAMIASTILIGTKQSCKLNVEVVNSEGVTTHWLNATSKTWVTESTRIITEETSLNESTSINWTKAEIEIVGFPGGRLKITLISEYKTLSLQYTGVAFDNVTFYAKEASSAPTTGVLTGQPLVNGIVNKFTEIPDEVEFTQNDAPVDNAEDASLYFTNYMTLADGAPTTSWVSANHSGTLAKIYLFAVLEAHGRSMQVKTINGRGLISPHTRLIDHNNKKFQIISYSHSDKTNQFTCEATEIIEPGTIEILTNFTSEESSSGSSGSTNGDTTTESSTTSDDRLVSMLADSGMESGAPGKLYAPYFDYTAVGSTLVYFPKRLSTLKSGRAYYAKGTHNVTFTTPFVTPDTYMVIPYGSTGTASFVPVITDITHLDYFTMKVTVDGYVSWVAYVISNE